MRDKIIHFIILCFSISSCRELVQDEFSQFEIIVTANTLISAGDSVKISLSYTDELNENPLESIENADIKMTTQNHSDISVIHQGGGVYISDYIAQPKDTVNLTVLIPHKDVVSSTCVVPEAIDIFDADVDPYGSIDDEGTAASLAYVKVKNRFDIPIYGVVYIRTYTDELRYSIDLDNPEATYSIDTVCVMQEDYKVIGTIDNINNYGEFLEKELKVTREFYSSNTISFAFQLKLRTVDYNYYTYINSIGAYEVGRNPDFTNSFIAPINIYTNIENGYGIMGAYSEFETDTIF